MTNAQRTGRRPWVWVSLLAVVLAVCGAFSWGFLAAQFQVFPYDAIRSVMRGSDPAPSGRAIGAADAKWAEAVVEGGYILFFRHTEREKWTDVLAFDMLEIGTGARAEDESYARASCLTERGREEAKMIGAVFDLAGVAVSEVITSPSCRARQTASLAFGRERRVENALFYGFAGNADGEPAARSLRATLDAIEVVPGENVVMTGHSSTLTAQAAILIDRNDLAEIPNWEKRSEGGFVVLEKDGLDIVVRHVFENFSSFARQVLVLPGL